METETAEKKMKVIPELRFQEFKQDWLPAKLKDGIDLVSGQHLSPEEYKTSSCFGFPYFTGPSDFTDNKLNVKKWCDASRNFATKDDVLITVKGSGVGTMTLLKLNKVAMGRQLMGIRSTKFSSEFIYHYLLTKQNLFVALASGNMIPGLSRQDILSLKISLPSLLEQQKIATFLSAVDKKIQQLSRKKELLESFKKGVMQKLFSQEIRFKDDDGKDFPEWEERKMSNFIEDFKSQSSENNQYEVLTSSNKGLMKQVDYFGANRLTDRNNKGFNIIPPGYLTYRSRSDNRKFSFNENKLGITGVISTYYPVFKMKNGSNRFFIELTSFYESYIGKYSVGTSQTVLSLNSLKEIKFNFPCDKEQQRIADFLSVIDSKIKAVSERIEKTQSFKKGLLQQMFV